MVKVVAKHFVKADKIDEYISLAGKLVKETNEKDAGCIKYELFQDNADPKILTIIEEWESQELLDRHMEAKHFKELVPLLGELCEKPGEINLYRLLA